MGLTSAHTIYALCCDLKSTLYQAQSTFSFFQQLFRNRKFLPVCMFVGGKKGTPYTFTYANFDYVSGALLPLLQHENIPEYYVNYKINRVYAWNSFRSPRPRRPHSNKKKTSKISSHNNTIEKFPSEMEKVFYDIIIITITILK